MLLTMMKVSLLPFLTSNKCYGGFLFDMDRTILNSAASADRFWGLELNGHVPERSCQRCKVPVVFDTIRRKVAADQTVCQGGQSMIGYQQTPTISAPCRLAASTSSRICRSQAPL
jgi:hypothetical protein